MNNVETDILESVQQKFRRNKLQNVIKIIIYMYKNNNMYIYNIDKDNNIYK